MLFHHHTHHVFNLKFFADLIYIMSTRLLLLLIWSIHLSVSATRSNSDDDDAVFVLTDSSWEDSVSDIWLVKFYAPWCAHCKQYAPIFKQTAVITNAQHGYINFGQMDCDANTITCSEYRITGYPTTLLLYNGKLIAKYRESRDSATRIQSWILSQLEDESLRSKQVFEEEEINAIHQLKQNWLNHKTKPKRKRVKNKNKIGDAFKIFPWEFNGINDLYYHILGDTHPTVPFLIYLIGTVSGIVIGVAMVFCATN
eukprot:332157_1